MSWSNSPSSSVATSTPVSSLLVAQDDDILIPSPSQVRQTFHDGRETWQYFLGEAIDMPPGLWPAGTLDPYITLSDVPALPANLPQSEFLYGRPGWKMRRCKAGQHDMWTLQVVPGHRVSIRLRIPEPIRCHIILSKPASCFLGISSKTRNSLAVLTACWSYILSVRLLEMQGRKTRYSTHRLWPQQVQDQEQPAIHLDGASPTLVRWLCAILCHSVLRTRLFCRGPRAAAVGCCLPRCWHTALSCSQHESLNRSRLFASKLFRGNKTPRRAMPTV